MKKIIVLSIMLTLVAMGSMGFIGYAYAQYMGNVGETGQTGVGTLEETLELAARRLEAVEANPASGSGTPYLDAEGIVGASVIAGAIFGGISAVFFFKGRSGKYAAQGRG